MAKLVTHAVYRIDGGTPKGYGKTGGVGQIANDGAVGATYTWFPTYVRLTPDQLNYFEDQVRKEAAKVWYTGVGANCYTPIYLALYSLSSRSGLDDSTKGWIAKLIKDTESSNLGMGTTISNTRLATNAAVTVGKWTQGLDSGLSASAGYYLVKGALSYAGGKLGSVGELIKGSADVVAHVAWLYLLYQGGAIPWDEFMKRAVAVGPLHWIASKLRQAGYQTIADLVTNADVGLRYV